jgi:hypothetical protein
MVGEIDERELVIGRRIAWYPNGPGWIEKVYHGMWRGRQARAHSFPSSFP